MTMSSDEWAKRLDYQREVIDYRWGENAREKAWALMHGFGSASEYHAVMLDEAREADWQTEQFEGNAK